jgi:hypothetical protein
MQALAYLLLFLISIIDMTNRQNAGWFSQRKAKGKKDGTKRSQKTAYGFKNVLLCLRMSRCHPYLSISGRQFGCSSVPM